MKKLLFFAFAIAAGAVTSFGANTWTKESWSLSDWVIPNDALSGDPESHLLTNFGSDGSSGFGGVTKTWVFAEPKDLSSVQILMNGNSYKVASVSVQYAGAEEFVELDGSALDFTKDTGGCTRMVFADSKLEYFAENVIGLKVVMTDVYPYWANAHEIFVIGKTRGSTNHWKIGTYSAGEWTPAADRLKGVMNGADSWGDSAANLEDDDAATIWWSTSSSLTWNFDAPKRIRRVRLCGGEGSGGGFKVSSVSVKYNGADEYVKLPGSSLDMVNVKTSRYDVELTAENGVLASDVVSLKVNTVVYNWRFAIGEAEVDGQDSFVSTLDADYLVAGGKLTTKLTGVASEYPMPVYICTGEVDGGKDVTQWDNVVKVGELADAETPLEDSRIVDFKFCRFYFPDVDNEAWSEPFELVLEPSATAQVTERRSTDAKIETVIDFCGGTNEVAAAYFAYAQKGEELPVYTLVEANVPTGKTVSVKVTGLTSLASYAYQVKIVNVDGGELVIPGEFDSRGDAYWEKGFYLASEWVNPEDRIQCGNGVLYDCKVAGITQDQIVKSLGSNSVVSCTWQEPKNIDYLELYQFGSKDWRFEILRVEIQYAGDDAYVALSGTHLDFRESVSSGLKLGVLRGSDGPLAENVKSIRFISGYWNSNWAHGIAELVIHGTTVGDSGKLKWYFGSLAAEETYEKEPDALEFKNGSGGAFEASLIDGNIKTGPENTYNGASYTLTFDEAKDVRQLRIFGRNGSQLGFTPIEVKYKGEDAFTPIVGTAMEWVGTSGNGYAILRGVNGKGFVAKNVVALKFKLTISLYTGWLSEIEVDGRKALHGLMMIVK